MITLHPLAVTDLSFSYAHKLDDTHIRHYRTSIALDMVQNKNSAERVKDYIKKETGEDVQFEQVTVESSPGGLGLISLVPEVLNDLPKASKQLGKKPINSLIYQYVTYNSLVHKLQDRLIYIYNSFAIKINSLCYKLFKSYIVPTYMSCGDRRMSLCRFLTVKFEESDREKAIEMLRNDIKKLSDLGLIIGHLAKPMQIALADTIGSGQKAYGLCCFLFLDDYKLAEMIGTSMIPYSLVLKEFLGIKTESFEGELTSTDLDPLKKYVIEIIDIGAQDHQDRLDAYIKSYEEQREMIEKLNKKDPENCMKIKAEEEQQRRVSYSSEACVAIDADAPTLVSDKKD